MLEVFKGKEVRVTLHAVNRFLSRYYGPTPSNTYQFLTDRVNKLLEGKIPSVELVRITDEKDYNLKHPKSISLYDIGLSLIFVISYNDFSVVTIRKDLHNFKKPKNSVFKDNIINNWIPVVDKDNIDYVYNILKNIKKFPETLILYKCNREEVSKKSINKYFKYNIKNVIEVDNLDFQLDDEILYTIHIDTKDNLSLNNSIFFHHELIDDQTVLKMCKMVNNELIIIKTKKYRFDRSVDFILFRNLKNHIYKRWLEYFKEMIQEGE